jgi:hypothetical protein
MSELEKLKREKNAKKIIDPNYKEIINVKECDLK